jgi:hypothetical protein
MEEGGEPAPDAGAGTSEKHASVERTVASVSEQLLSGASVVAGITAVARAAAGELPVVGPLVATAVAGLLPIAIAAIERNRETRTTRGKRAQAWANDAWDAVVAARAV